MHWRIETYEQRRERINEWQPWFAWYPVKDRDHGYRMWCEKVLYKWSEHHSRRWDYRPITILETDLKAQETIAAEKTVVPSLPGKLYVSGPTHGILTKKKLPRR